MKKVVSVILILVTLSICIGCELQEHTYIISERTCNTMFSHPPEEWEEAANISYWAQGEYVSADVDEEGNLVLVLNDKHIAHWKRELTESIKTQQDAEKRDGEGYGFEYDETYTTLIYNADREVSFGVIIGLGILVPKFAIMQMLNGADPNEWYVDITVKDVETGITVKTGRVPDDGSFGLFDEDWDKALGPAEQEQNNVTERR